MDLLSTDEIDTLNAARAVLKDLQYRASIKVPLSHADYLDRESDIRNLGRLDQACKIAGDVVFNVLNVASAHAGVPITDAQMHPFRTEDL